MTVSEIRKIAGLTQAAFAKKYKIPLSTIKQWESNPESKSFRKCPEYVLDLLEKVALEDANNQFYEDYAKLTCNEKDNKNLTDLAESVW